MQVSVNKNVTIIKMFWSSRFKKKRPNQSSHTSNAVYQQ